MTKQKFVLKLKLDDGNKRKKALKTVATTNGIFLGVTSMRLDGDKLIVIGDGTDEVHLTTQLRKKMGYADLISVSSGDENVQPLVYPYQYSYA
ncbi:Heavy metal transport/detoxification superfamily protein [Rhynchospora pubera]|uniref:Heavy metal transport/detoxification superfamily protein n=1 Tax=Rhynchospora pubera TaxID=906938 RepID=A0AAV8FFV5_9POAL|nr:Heavy metal transport/detoxification superfamily protein [Rhynchospora pubera]